MASSFVTSFGPREYTNSQLLQLGDEIVDILIPGLPDDALLISDQLDDFRFAVVDMARALGRPTTSGMTESKRQFDELRDQIWVGMKTQITGILKYSGGSIQASARLLDELMRKRENRLQDLSYAENTAQLKLFFKEFEIGEGEQAAEAFAALETLHMTEAFEALVKANADFEQAVLDETDTLPDDAQIPRLAPSKASYAKYFRLILKNLEYYAEKGTQPYVDLLMKCSDRIIEKRTVAQTRNSRTSSDSSSDVAVAS